MDLMAWLVVISLAAAGPASAARESSPEAKRALSAAAGQALQGDMQRAIEELNAVPASEFGAKEGAIRSCMIERFSHDAKPRSSTEPDTFSTRALALYRRYWRAALLHPESRPSEERRLHSNLADLTGLSDEADPEQIEDEVKQRFAEDGLHVLMGRTPPLLELIAWKKETTERRRVVLPEGEREVTVSVLDDFASLGWSAYATCDRSFTGGWVQSDAVYAVRPGWKDLTAENFRISFLAHETQHFADKRQFGDLESWELEYRAKLAELALADTTVSRILSGFISNQGSDRAVPHSYANRLVLSWLVRELALTDAESLADVPPEDIRRAATDLLVRDTAVRQSGERGATRGQES